MADNPTITLYHNPRCSKSRQTLQLLRDNGVEPTIVEYLKTPPTPAELDRILKLLGLEPRELMRRKEAAYKEQNLADTGLGRDELIRAMVDHPILIERPVAVTGDRAAVGRPPENVAALLD